MQPVRRIESILADLTYDGAIVENRPTGSAFDSFSQWLTGERSVLALFGEKSVLALFGEKSVLALFQILAT